MKKFFTATLAAVIFFASTATAAPMHKDRETIYQVALLQSLAMGYFDGSITVKQLKRHGDTGIGTFEGVDGEMIVLDGVVYRANQNCEINVVADNVTVPFANVTFFETDSGGEFVDYRGKDALDAALNDTIREDNAVDTFHMVKITGEFSDLVIRSESKQSKPYPTLVNALKATQKEFTHKKIRGTIVGLYCPEFMNSLNSVGWHYHFISEDKKIGGHVLNVNIVRAMVEMDKTAGFRMDLPKTTDFNALDFKKDMNEDIRSAERDTIKK